MSENPLSNLKIDYWYKALLVLAAFVLVISLCVEMKGVENSVVQMISLGAILVGFGEWINHPLQEKIGVGFKLTGHPRKNTISGNLFDLAGLAFIIVGVVKIFG